MEQEQSKIKSDILLRVKALYIFFLVLVLVILVRLVAVQFFCPETRINADRLSKRIFTREKVYARRGSILARNDEPLAISIFRYRPLVDFDSEGFRDTAAFFKQSDSLGGLLATYFGDRSAGEYARMLQRHWREQRGRVKGYRDRDTSYYNDELPVLPLLVRLVAGTAKVKKRVRDTIRFHRPIAILPREVDYAEWEELQNYPILNYSLGFTYRLNKSDRRVYPQGDLARRTIGRISEYDSTGYGVERIFSEQLAGIDGFSTRQRIARGFSTRTGEGEHRAAIDGSDVVTTLDITLQDVADRALRRQIEEQQADWGTTLVMEVATGELLAMVNLGRGPNGKLSERENYALGRSMEPGSTLKLATMLALLDDAKMSPSKRYETHDGNKVDIGPAHDIRDSHRGDHEIDLKRAVAGSSNVYFAKAYWDYYGITGRKEQLTRYLHDVLGLDETVGLEPFGERPPYLATDWKVPDPGVMLVKMAYGYRVQMTPLQMITLYNAIANGGCKVAPKLIREVRHPDGRVERFPTKVLRKQICTEPTLSIVRDCLEEVARTGTAAPYFGDATHLRVAAKTGTAQVTSGQKGNYLGSMVAYFPADKPRYTVLTTIHTRQQTGKAYYGASLAGPVVKRVVDYIYAREADWSEPLARGEHQRPATLKGGSTEQLSEVADRVMPRGATKPRAAWGRVAEGAGEEVRIEAVEVAAGRIPNVVGMGLKDALFVLESSGLQVNFEGRGAVVWQSLQPQTPIAGNEQITIRLK